MAVQCVDLKCSGCGGGLTPAESFCKYCGKAVVITSFNSVYDRPLPELNKLSKSLEKDIAENGELASESKFTVACCYLKLKLYDKALQKFEEAIEENFDNPETYFYAAVSLLKGKKAFLTPLADIKKAMEYANAALMIENRGVFNYFLAYLKYDFYARKFLRISPSWQEELSTAQINNLSPTDAKIMFDTLAVECPPELMV